MQLESIKEYKGLSLSKSIRVHSIGKEVPAGIQDTLRIQAEMEENYQASTIEVKGFKIYMQSEKATGTSADITEEDLIQMLEFVRSQKNKTYKMESQ